MATACTPNFLALKPTVKSFCRSRWIVALASFFLMISSGGALNTYSLYSQEMKISLHYNQKAINSISFFKDLGTSLGIVAGFIYGRTGPWPVLILASMMNLFGYLMIWMGTTHRIHDPQVWEMCIYIFMVGASVGFTLTAVLSTCARNFPNNQSTLLSLLDSSHGLGGAIFTLMFQATYENKSSSSFLLLLAWLPSALCLVFLCVVRHVSPSPRSRDAFILYTFLGITLALAGYLMVVIIIQNAVRGLESSIVKAMFSIMVVILVLPVGVVLISEVDSTNLELQAQQGPDHVVKEAADDQVLELSVIDKIIPAEKDVGGLRLKTPKRGCDHTVLQAVFSIDMWLLMIATTCGVGAVSTVVNNLGQMGAALGYSETQANTFIALFSIWDFLGGVGCGFISDILLHKFGIPRPFFFASVLGILALGNLLMALAIPGALYAGSIMVGLATGGQWAVLYTTIAEIFGLKYYGILQNFSCIAKGIGTYVLSVQVAGALYDKQTKEESESSGGTLMAGDELLCRGPHCYKMTFFIMSAACFFACLIALVLCVRTARFYRQDIRNRVRSLRIEAVENSGL